MGVFEREWVVSVAVIVGGNRMWSDEVGCEGNERNKLCLVWS